MYKNDHHVNKHQLFVEQLVQLLMLQMEDENGEDCKVLALPIEKVCPHYSRMKSLQDIPELTLSAIAHFFEHYKKLEPNKWVKIGGWVDIDAATKEINDSIKRYKS